MSTLKTKCQHKIYAQIEDCLPTILRFDADVYLFENARCVFLGLFVAICVVDGWVGCLIGLLVGEMGNRTPERASYSHPSLPRLTFFY